MSTTKYIVAAMLVCLMSIGTGHAQWKSEADTTVKLPRWEPHLNVSTGFMGTSYGDNRLYTSVAPLLTFRPNSRWAVNAGFRITSDMGLNPNYAFSSPERSLAPYKHRNGGTGLASAHVAAQYQVSDRLWLAAAVYHLGGTYAPVYGFGNGEVFDVSATAISAAAAYRFSDDSFLHLSFTYVRDGQGTLPYLYHDAWMHGYGAWGMYGSPIGCYGMGVPHGHCFGGVWY